MHPTLVHFFCVFFCIWGCTFAVVMQNRDQQAHHLTTGATMTTLTIKRISSTCYAVNVRTGNQFDPACDSFYFPSLKQAKAFVATR